MKKILIFIVVIVASLMTISCDKKEDMYKVLPVENVKKPVLQSPGDITVTLDNLSSMVTFKWQKADFGVPTAPEYTLFLKQLKGDPIRVSSSFDDHVNVKLADLNKMLIASGIEPGKSAEAEFYIEAMLYADYKVASELIKVKVTPFKPLYPDVVYMIGQEFGEWDWKSPRVATMIPINGHEGKFWAVRYFANPVDGFKWNTKKEWGGDFYSLGNDVGFNTHDGNAFVEKAGFYIVVIDYTINTITIEPAKVYGIGDCFGGWDMGKYPFTAEGDVMKIKTANEGELRIYTSSEAAGIGGDWWRMEFIITDGKIDYRGNGGDQPRVKVGSGKTITLDFNNETGSIS